MKSYKTYKNSFTQWLNALGYADSTLYSMPHQLEEFFNWLTQNGITALNFITTQHTENFIRYNSTRANRRRGGGLSAGHINKYIDTINKFNVYLKNTGEQIIPINVQRLEEQAIKPRLILTPEEIKQLYAATDESPFGIRDRAMLSVYYGCGLRKTEGVELDLSDVLSERQILYIRKTKNSYERYVPITTTCLKHIEQYIYNSRPLFLADQSPLSTRRGVGGEAETALFISERGTRISKQIFYLRLKVLCKTAGIDKEIGVHNLRHSIATHLMQQGMELENIGLFLGHRCLDSTQLYTHLINEIN